MESPIDTYKTIQTRGTSLFRDRGSKFLGFAFPVKDREEIKVQLKELKSLHPKARHHCYAWRLGVKGIDFRSNDNGEPSGSAGRPILGQIDSFGLSYVLVVVVRYFGGTLLGIPGLINAYKTAAADSLSDASIVLKEVTENLQLDFDYTLLNDVMQLLQQFGATIHRQEMTLFCSYTVAVPVGKKEAFLSRAGAIYQLKVSPIS